MSAVFSPDSKKIALSTEFVNESDPYTINIMNAETGMSLKKIDVSLKDAEAPLFSPDSRLILVNRPRGSRQIMAADVYDATTGSRFFTINGKGHFFPDGSKIALVSDMGIVRIYVMGSTAADVYSLSGRYVVNRNELVLKINIKQGGIIKYHFDLAGKKDKLAELAKKAVVQVIEWMKK